MSRTVTALIALMLGFPIVAFVAVGEAGGLNPSFYSDAIGFVTGVCFVGAAFLEAASVEMASRHEFDRTRVEVFARTMAD